MGSVILFDAARMQEIEDSTVVAGFVDINGHLILERRDGDEIDAGNVQAPNLVDASTTVKGIVELATNAETQTGTDTERAITPAALTSRSATTSRTGIAELATDAEALTGTDTQRIVTPASMKYVFGDFSDKLNKRLGNRIINGSFRTNQRSYVSGATITPGSYCFDRWQSTGYTNLIPNGSGEVNVTGWVSDTFRTTTRVAHTTGIPGEPNEGSYFIRTTFGGFSGGLSDSGVFYSAGGTVIGGRTYTFSVWVRSNKAQRLTASMQWNVSGSTIGTGVVVAAGVWTKLTFTGIAPPGATNGAPFVYNTNNGTGLVGWSVGDSLDADCLMMVEAPTVPSNFIDGSLPGYSWAGASYASVSYSVPVVPTLTATLDANFGQEVTLNSGGQVRQVIERSRMPAGVYSFAHDGTAQMRVYDVGSTPPSYAASPVAYVSTGANDVIVEFYAHGGSSKTIANVRGDIGTTDPGFRLDPIDDEILTCWRYYRRLTPGPSSVKAIAMVAGFGANDGYMPITFPVKMRVPPALPYSSLSHFNFLIGSAGATLTNIILNLSDTDMVEVRLPVSAGGVSGGGGWLRLIGATNTAWLAFDAEMYV